MPARTPGVKASANSIQARISPPTKKISGPFGAPLGAWLASRMTNRQLVVLVVVMALSELATTIIFLEPLRTNPALVIYSVVGMVVITAILLLMLKYRRQILGLPPVDLEGTFTRTRLDVGGDFREDLVEGSDTDRDGTPDGTEGRG